MIDRLRERPGKLLPMLLFAAVAALLWWLGLLAIGVAEILFSSERMSFDSDLESGISESLDAASWWIALAGIVIVPIATLAWSRAIEAGGWVTVSGVVASCVVYLLYAVPIYMLWVFLYDTITGDEWSY